MVSFKDFIKFLKQDDRLDLKILALHELLGLTGSKDGCKTVQEDHDALQAVFQHVGDPLSGINKYACMILVNISATEEGANEIIKADSKDGKEILVKFLREVLNPGSRSADFACKVLSNITRQACYAQLILDSMNDESIKVDELVNAFTRLNFNNKRRTLDYLAPFFSNLSQCPEFRRNIMDKSNCLIQKLLPFVHFEKSSIRRRGIVATIRNCCFDTEYHEWLLSSEIDILPTLLLPLAGPEEFDEEDTDKLPLELQYLGEAKKREVDDDIRKLLLEAINQLCALRSAREYLRKKNTYVILREYHKREKDRSLILAIENIIDILIRSEDEIGQDNLKSLDVPNEYVKKFEEMDKEFLKENEGGEGEA